MRNYLDEKWCVIDFEKGALRLNYAVSNYGRIVSYRDDIGDGKLLKNGILGGYPTFVCRPFKKSKTIYIHKLVAAYFLQKASNDELYVLHLDYNKLNNHTSNLRWAIKRDMEKHQQSSPFVLKSREKRKLYKPSKGQKLTSTDVMRIKRKIFDPNRKTRLKIIAKQFGISEMQLYRIKSGENWSHVTLKDQNATTGAGAQNGRNVSDTSATKQKHKFGKKRASISG